MTATAWIVVILLSVIFSLIVFVLILFMLNGRKNKKIILLEDRIEQLMNKREKLVSEIKKNEKFKSSNIDDAINEFNSI